LRRAEKGREKQGNQGGLYVKEGGNSWAGDLRCADSRWDREKEISSIERRREGRGGWKKARLMILVLCK